VASLYAKQVAGKTYWYLREMARIDGKPKMVSERYLGSAADIAAAMDARDAQIMPERTRHQAFGDVAAVWAMLQRLDLAGIVDGLVGARRADAGASVGTYLALATLNRVVDPCSKLAFADWWARTAADRFTKIPARVLDHRRFWNAMRAVTTIELAEIERAVSARMIAEFGLDTSGLALDMTNFATYLDNTNPHAPLAQRGKAKQKRADLRLIGLGLIVTRDGGIPLLSHTYPGNKPDVTQFTTMIDELRTRHTRLGGDPAAITVVFDAGQNSVANFAHLAAAALPAHDRRLVDAGRFDQLTALDTRREVYGQDRRVVLTHSPSLHTAQARGFAQTLAKAQARLGVLADTLARGRTRRPAGKVTAEIEQIIKDPWVKRVLTWQLTGDTPAQLRLTWQIDEQAHTALAEEIFGKRILVTDHDDWPITDIVAAYRSQSEAEFGFRQLKDPHVVSFSPMHHWTDHHIRVHTQTCVFALMTAHLMRRHAAQAGLHLSVRAILDHLAGIGETVLIYPSTGGRPKARRILTETSEIQQHLMDIFDLNRWKPRS
jgi:transposase